MDALPSKESRGFFFQQIVKNDADFVGMVGYILYKQNKIAYIKDYAKKHGEEPSDEHLKQWQANECIGNKIEQYRTNAQAEAAGFINRLLANRKEELANNEADLLAKESHLNILERELEKREQDLDILESDLSHRNRHCPRTPKHSYWISVSQSVIGSIIVILISLLAVALIFGNSDVVRSFKDTLTGH